MTVPRRRWSFSLRTMLAGVTLVALPLAWVGWQIRIVRMRKAALADISHCKTVHQLGKIAGAPDLNPLRRWLGDEQIADIWFINSTTEVDQAQLRSIFPEATVDVNGRRP